MLKNNTTLYKLFILFTLVLIILFSSSISIFTLFSQSIRLDESQSLWVATKSIPTILYLIGQDVHVPLYELLLHFWLQIFGVSLIVSRTLSLVFFLITLPVLFILYKEASNEKIALASVLAFSISPFILWYSSESRMYTLFVFATTLNSLFFLRFLRSNGKSGYIGYFFSTLIGLYTHYFFLFFLISQGIFLIVRTVLEQRKEIYAIHIRFLSRARYRVIFSYVGLVLGAVVLFVPWFLYVAHLGFAATTQPLIPKPTTFNIFQTFANFIFGFQSQPIQAIIISLWPLLIMLLFFIFTKRHHVKTYGIEYLITISFLPIALVYFISLIHPIFLSRYLIFTTPSLFFIIIWLLVSYPKRIASFLLTGFLLLMLSLLLYQNFSHDTPVKEDYQATTKYLEVTAKPSDIITVTAPFTIYPIEYLYNGHARLSSIPIWDRYTQAAIPAFSINNLAQQIKTYTSEYERIFIVFSYNQGYENKIKDYMDHHYRLLQRKQFSPGLEVREYQLRYQISN